MPSASQLTKTPPGVYNAPPPAPKPSVGMMFVNEAVMDSAMLLVNPGMLGVKIAGEVALATAGKLTRSGTKVGMGISRSSASVEAHAGSMANARYTRYAYHVGTATEKMMPKTMGYLEAAGSVASDTIGAVGTRVKRVTAKYPKTVAGTKKLFKVAKVMGEIVGEVGEFEDRLLGEGLDDENMTFLGGVEARDREAYMAAVTIKADSMGVSPEELKAAVDRWLANNYDSERGRRSSDSSNIARQVDATHQIFEDASVPLRYVQGDFGEMAHTNAGDFCEMYPLHPRCRRMGAVARMRAKRGK